VPGAVLEELATSSRPLHERLAHWALLRRPPRGRLTVLHWDRHRRLRALGAPGSDDSFPRYMRDLAGAPNWRGVVLAHSRAHQRRAARRAT